MGLFDNWNGGATRKEIWAGIKEGQRQLDQGAGQAHGWYDQALGRSQSLFDPYSQGGAEANALYRNALGVNGLEPQRQFYQSFQADPGYQSLLDAALRAGQRQANAGGRNYSGAAIAGQANTAAQMTNQLYNQRLDRLRDLSSQGLGAAGAQMQTEGSIYGNKADLDWGKAQLNSNSIQAGANAVSATRGVGLNNLLKLGGLALQAYTGGVGGAGGGASTLFAQGMGGVGGGGY